MQIWENTTKDIEDIPEKIVLLKKQAQSRFDRIRKEAMEQVLVDTCSNEIFSLDLSLDPALSGLC
jgi:hypothetical protein